MTASVSDAGAPTGPRYAVYFVPSPESALYRFGSGVIGYDCFAGRALPPPPDVHIGPAEWEALTRGPRTYGFHATLKAPFRLAAGHDEAALVRAFDAFAAARQAAPSVDPRVDLVGDFVAIVEREPCPALRQLADACVAAFDPFRAPLSAQDLARRKAGLSAAQAVHLERWGYPYVFDQFRFHMTLTGRIGPDRRAGVLAIMREAFGRDPANRRFAIDSLALLVQEQRDAPFHMVRFAPR
jgi:putative phosphonate metabolism protein